MESGAIVKCLPLSAPADGETSYPNLSPADGETSYPNLSPADGETLSPGRDFLSQSLPRRGRDTERGVFAIQRTETEQLQSSPPT